MTPGVVLPTAYALVLGVLDLVWGIGALRRRPWAWTLGVAVGTGYLLGPLLRLVGMGFILGVSSADTILAVLLLVCLGTPQVRRLFDST